MGNRLKGKRALVTGAAAGIGRACALAFACEGASVLATDIDVAMLEKVCTDVGEIEVARLDVTDDVACAAISTQWPEIDVLLNAAGYVHHGTILECGTDDWTRSWSLNVTSMYRTVRAVLPSMLSRRTGSIINIASVVSSLKGAPQRAAYATTKAAVIGLTKSVAADYVTAGIRCNAICPGTVDSPSLVARMSATGDPTAARRAFAERQPMKRLGRPEEIAALAVYLASDESSFTTGSALVIDGGWLG